MDTAGIAAEVSAFLRLAFGPHDGFACIALLRRSAAGGRMFHHFYHLPSEFEKMISEIDVFATMSVDVYYCPNLFKSDNFSKDNVLLCPSIYSDLDECSPEDVMPPPSLAVETSPGRFQALWVIQEGMPPEVGEDMSKRMAYAYADRGADLSGWDLVQLLRVPGTFNMKYIDTNSGPVVVQRLNTRFAQYRNGEIDLPEVAETDSSKFPFPTELEPGTGRELMDRFRARLPERAFRRHDEVPLPVNGQSTWSQNLFGLEMDCYEAGMTREQVYQVCLDAACNKFARDGRTTNYLWQDVCRAWSKFNQRTAQLNIVKTEPEQSLLTDEEAARVTDVETVVERYIKWASSLGDAAQQYHQAGAFIMLSALLAGNVVLPTSFGTIKPNLWFMILADTTLTRKSTAMDIAMDLLAEINSDAILATDGSIEGLMQGLAGRPGKPSIFLRDEFSGLIEQITKKDYYAGMAETLTKLYDGKLQKRMLKKETIEVRDPVVIIFAGGIRTRVQQLLTLDHVSSGFVPRFLFITAESDASRLQPLGPPTDLDTSGRDELRDEFTDLWNFYHQESIMALPDGKKVSRPARWEARLTDAAWLRYNQFENQMVREGLRTERPDLMTPLYDRLSKSTLKAAVLLAATRYRQEDVVIDVDDILLAIRYAQGWREYAVDVVNGVGKSIAENQLDSVYNNIKRRPGINRAMLMRHHHLTAREADAVFATLEQRGLITSSRIGKGSVYHAA